jgi:hypothetical protein
MENYGILNSSMQEQYRILQNPQMMFHIIYVDGKFRTSTSDSISLFCFEFDPYVTCTIS